MLVLTDFAPPNQVGEGSSGVSLTFTSPTAADFTDASGNSGTVTLLPGPATDFSSLSGWTIVLASPTAATPNTVSFGDGVFTNTDGNGNKTIGTYTSMQYGPMATMIVSTSVDPNLGGIATNYLMFLFASSGGGNASQTYFDGAGDLPSYVSGSFTGIFRPSGLEV